MARHDVAGAGCHGSQNLWEGVVGGRVGALMGTALTLSSTGSGSSRRLWILVKPRPVIHHDRWIDG